MVESHGVTLDTVAEPFNMTTFGLMAAFGKVELDNFRERARMGKRGAAKAGRAPIGSVPFGYAIAEDGRLELVPDDAAIVADLFSAYVNDGKGTAEIARELEARTGRRWHSSHIHRMLANSAYKGLWMYGKDDFDQHRAGQASGGVAAGGLDRDRLPTDRGHRDLGGRPGSQGPAPQSGSPQSEGVLHSEVPCPLRRVRGHDSGAAAPEPDP